MKTKKDIKGLIKDLKYEKDSSVRQGAAEALGRIGNVRAVDPLIQALKDGDSGVRIRAAGALAKIRGTSRRIPHPGSETRR